MRKHIQRFRQTLLAWAQEQNRPMPWKGETDPYLIWLSEIILQQTRVEQGWAYFLKFKNTFPTVHDLAAAAEQDVLKLWEGLGYYSRARNLHHTAQHISRQLNGRFPDSYEGILQLKGVGPYTAAAISSFAFGLPHAVVDGNVYRVLSRIFGIATSIDTTAGKQAFSTLAQDLLDPEAPGIYNQAIMDFGATQCTPKSPACGTCPFTSDCIAQQQQRQEELPVKSKKLQKRDRFFHYLILENKAGEIWIRQRGDGDVWQGLFDFPLIESPQLHTELEALGQEDPWVKVLKDKAVKLKRRSRTFKQTLSHQHIWAHFFELQYEGRIALEALGATRIPRKNIQNYPKPKIVDLYLRDNSLILDL
ncbi:MAG: A/G-specific adenine glycosylase [Phaeodactylibacter sp.]|nr:A/G-specific adenine glycosylase [Phaeodactylibacter sp.]